MPHDNQGRCWVDTTSNPNVGIDFVGDVAYVLGRNTGDEGQLCGDITAAGVRVYKINVWAKNKSMRFGFNTITAQQRANDNYGLTFPILRGVNTGGLVGPLYEQFENDSESVITKRMNGWGYLPPRGTSYSEKFRILDFDGYYHNAANPLQAGDGQEHSVSTELSSATTLAAIRRQSSDFGDDEIDLATMPNLEDYYFCVVGYKVNSGTIQGGTHFIVSASRTIGQGTFSANVYFTGSHFPSGYLGTWYVYPCLCSVGNVSRYANSGSDPSANYIPLPCSKKWIYNVVSNVRYATLYAQKPSATGSTLYYNYTIHNEGSQSYTFRDVTVWIMHSGRTPDDVRQYDEREILIGDVTVAANGTSASGWVAVTNIPSTLYANAVFFLTCYAGFDRVGPIAPLMPQDDGGPDFPIIGNEY